MSTIRIEYTGSLELATVPELVEQVHKAAQDNDTVLLDVSNLEFVDSTGVRSLLTLKEELGRDGRRFIIEGFRPPILEILEILGIREMLVGSTT